MNEEQNYNSGLSPPDCTEHPLKRVFAKIGASLDLPKLNKSPSPSDLYKLIDTVRGTRDRIKSLLGEPIAEGETATEGDLFYVHIIMTKLDSRTLEGLIKWLDLANDKIPTLGACVQFLENEAKSIYMVQAMRTSFPSSSRTKKNRLSKSNK